MMMMMTHFFSSQRRDDDKVIELKRSINTIKAKFGQKTLVVGGGEVEPWGTEEDGEVSQSSIVRRNSTPGGTHREAPMTGGPSVRRHSMPHSSRSLTASPERRVVRSTSVEDQRAPEDCEAACASLPCQGITVTCEDASDDLVEKLHNEIQKNCHLLDPDHDAMRGRRSRSATPTPMDTILEDSVDKAREADKREAAADKPPVDGPSGSISESS